MKVTILALRNPMRDGQDRMCTWVGKSAHWVVTGVPDAFWLNCPMTTEVTNDATWTGPFTTRQEALKLANEVFGVVVTTFESWRPEVR